MNKLIIFILSMFILASCVEMVEGEGEVITRDYKLKSFHSVQLDLPGKLVVSQGEQSVSVTTNENIFEWLDIYVSEGMLRIGLRENVDVWRFDELLFNVSIPQPECIKLDGSGDVLVNAIDSEKDKVRIRIIGSGDIIIESLDVKHAEFLVEGSGLIRCNVLNANDASTVVDGSGDVTLSGNTDSHSISITGSGNINAYTLFSQEAFVEIEGAGDCHLFVRQLLDVEINGSGSVFYKGNPETSISIDGTGTVTPVY